MNEINSSTQGANSKLSKQSHLPIRQNVKIQPNKRQHRICHRLKLFVDIMLIVNRAGSIFQSLWPIHQGLRMSILIRI